MKTTVLVLFCACVSTLGLGAVACHKDTDKPAEGPMQRAGKSVDDTAAKASDDAKDAKDTLKKKASDAGL